MNYYSLDRLEGPLAVLTDEQGGELQVPAASLAPLEPPIREGETLVRLGGQWVRDEAETALRRKKNAALLANLRRRGSRP